ncbi:MAG: hypothetical protein MPJ50_01680 [Pirellulales bacterium]|nr:hypothetical protein [Pirellulales bacterium]
MDWSKHFMHDYWQTSQIDKLNTAVNALVQQERNTHSKTAERVDALEEELARAVLVIHTLLEVCVRKGVFSKEEFRSVVDEMDFLDGIMDGKLDPRALREEE